MQIINKYISYYKVYLHKLNMDREQQYLNLYCIMFIRLKTTIASSNSKMHIVFVCLEIKTWKNQNKVRKV